MRVLELGIAIVVASTISACASAPGENTGDTSAESDQALGIESSDNGHVMPKFESKASFADDAAQISVSAPAGAHLTYYGGPVLPSVKVYSVYWGSAATTHKAHIDAFYPSVTASTYFDWLKEYNTPTQHIGRGSFGGSYTITPSTTSKSISDKTIQRELAKQITAKHLPASDGTNALYMIYFPPGMKITGPGGSGTSCVQFCGYHGTFKQSAKYVFYSVIPDLEHDGCQNGCGTGTAENNLTEVSSHEMIEAVTDPGVGMAASLASPLAWYDQNNGEIGDICVGTTGTVNGYTVQLEWSNAKGACVAK